MSSRPLQRGSVSEWSGALAVPLVPVCNLDRDQDAGNATRHETQKLVNEACLEALKSPESSTDFKRKGDDQLCHQRDGQQL